MYTFNLYTVLSVVGENNLWSDKVSQMFIVQRETSETDF